MKLMARTIHETTASVVRTYSKAEIDEPDNPGVVALAKKNKYKRNKKTSRLEKKEEINPSTGPK